MAAAAVAGTMALSALVPLAANAQSFGYGGGSYASALGQLFVLGNLFGGAYGNGVIAGTSLGGILELNQIFNGGGFSGFGGGMGGFGGYGYY